MQSICLPYIIGSTYKAYAKYILNLYTLLFFVKDRLYYSIYIFIILLGGLYLVSTKYMPGICSIYNLSIIEANLSNYITRGILS